MKTKLISLEPYLTVLHSYDLLEEIVISNNKDVLEILKKHILENYKGEELSYLDFVIEEAIQQVDKDKLPIEKYLKLFEISLKQINFVLFNNNGKIKNLQTYKQVTSFVSKRIIFQNFLYLTKKYFDYKSEDIFFDVPYFIKELRDTHLHAGLAFYFEEALEITLKNFHKFEKILKREKKTRKNFKILQNYKILLNLSKILWKENLSKEEKKQIKNIFYLKNKNLPIPLNKAFFGDFSLKNLISKALENIFKQNVLLEQKLASVLFLVLINDVLKDSSIQTYYEGLQFFSEAYIRNNTLKTATNEAIKKAEFFEIYKNSFSKFSQIEGYELRMFPSEKAIKFWHKNIEVLKKEINKDFSLIVHFGKIKKLKEFEYIEGYYKNVYKKNRKLAQFFRDKPVFIKYFAGLDAASFEYWTPAWALSSLYRFWKNFYYIFTHRKYPHKQIKFTFHAGEDFLDIGTGLKNVYESIKFLELKSGDRIGHGLALGLDVKNYSLRYRKIKQNLLSYFFSLLWLNYLTYKHTELSGYKDRILKEISRLSNKHKFLREFFSKNEKKDEFYIFLINLYESLKFDFVNKDLNSFWGRLWNHELILLKERNPDNEILNIVNTIPSLFALYREYKKIYLNKEFFVLLDPLLDYESDFTFEEQVEFLERIKNVVLNEVIKKGIVIEACPSSNVYIRGLIDYKNHIVYTLKDKIKEGFRITLNTDDPFIFNNSLLEEFLIMNETLPEDEREIVLKNLIENSKDFAFKVE